MRICISFLLLFLAACGPGATSSSTAPPVETTASVAGSDVTTTTTTTPATTTSETSVTTTSVSTTTSSLTTTTLDLATPCAVVEAWIQAAAASDWVTSWSLTHPFTQTGIPLDSPNGGYAAGGVAGPSNALYQDETALSAAFWASVPDRQCSFFAFEPSWDTDTGVVTMTGTYLGGLYGGAYEVRTDGTLWKVDNFHIFIDIEHPELGVPMNVGDALLFKVPLGTFSVAALVDGASLTTTLDEHPSDLDAGRVTVTPPAPLSAGDHVFVAVASLENGVFDAIAMSFTASE